jgi:(E)-4-hydroxy-3-methylbut-2-enyl-diphosphate synthase
MNILRRKTRIIKIGDVHIGGDNPIAIQSMAKTKTADIEKTLRQIKGLEAAGCEIIRLAVRDALDAKAISKIKERARVPLVADIHFNWRLAIQAIDNGIDKIRLNPGNIYKKNEIKEIAAAARHNRIPIRVGVNSGSLRSARCKAISSEMVNSALDYIRILEGFRFYDIVVSLKGSNIFDTMDACRSMAKKCEYPLHLGITATGPSFGGAIKSSIAIGALLLEGIGDTIRVSLTDEPEAEVKVARSILETMDLRHFGPEIISCPTCGRCEVDLIKMVNEFKNRLSAVNCKLLTDNLRPLKVAIMGCVVNGPGEAAGADIGVAFGKKEGLLFKDGKAIKKVSFGNCIDYLLEETEKADGQYVKR